ncbi:hypothetical protein [Facklamia sp. P13069]|uniref:hypothetical protein n=1 Tax=Facklamia sp. P13069 TaxID=3421954 RepID=UPI003D16CF8D
MMDLFAKKFDVEIKAVASPKETIGGDDVITIVTTLQKLFLIVKILNQEPILMA